MTKIEKQQEKITNLLKLIGENPELEIMPMVKSECVNSDEWNCWMAVWGSARIDRYYATDERFYIESNDFEDVVAKFMDENCDEEEYRILSDEEFEKLAESKVEAYLWVKAIIVSIDPN